MGWRRSRLSPWPFWSKLGLAPSNRHRANGTHNGEMRRLGKRDKGAANDPRDSRRKDKLIIGRHISIDIDERENEVRRGVYGEGLDNTLKYILVIYLCGRYLLITMLNLYN